MKLHYVDLSWDRAIQPSLNVYGNHINAGIFTWLFDHYGLYPEEGPLIDKTPLISRDTKHFEASDAVWDVCCGPVIGIMRFMFKDPEHALLFKMTWSGQ